MQSQDTTVIFDLDGTLLDGDSTSIWMLGRIRKSAWRILLAVTVLPLALPLTFYAPTRCIGGSMFLWIASLGLNEIALRQSFAQFAARVGSDEVLAWRQSGLAQLEKYVLRQDTALIATAAPAWLAESLVETLPFRVVVVGSKLSRFLGGWVARYHCRHEAKCEAIRDAGYGDRWAIAYSDSAEDSPLLARATTAFLVNASNRTLKRITELRIKVELVVWK